jgi:hypothetical protein
MLFGWAYGAAANLFTAYPQLGFVARPLLRLGMKFADRTLVDTVADVMVYAEIDPLEPQFKVRGEIQQGAMDLLYDVLCKSTGEYEYSNVVLLGHSLGSVIAYDTINRINRDLNADASTAAQLQTIRSKLSALVTFGSPLDKIAYFFRPMGGEKNWVRRQILDKYHSFRALTWDMETDEDRKRGVNISDNVKAHLDDVVWLNFWDPQDPIAGQLDFYLVDYDVDSGKRVPVKQGADGASEQGSPAPARFAGNRMMDTGAGFLKSHTKYWSHVPMYEAIIKETLLTP